MDNNGEEFGAEDEGDDEGPSQELEYFRNSPIHNDGLNSRRNTLKNNPINNNQFFSKNMLTHLFSYHIVMDRK